MAQNPKSDSSLYDPEIGQFRKEIFHDLRAELGHLKTCQTSILILSATGAGLFLSLLRKDSYIPPEYLVLLPLIFLIPLWIIFFEKARTVARIVGFIRVQEKLYMYKSNLAAIGWESAMKLYRSKQNIWDDRKHDVYFKKSEPTKSPTTSTYWFMVYCTFFSLITTCLILSIIFLQVHAVQKITLILIIGLTFVLSFPILKLNKIGKKKDPDRDNPVSGQKGISAEILSGIFTRIKLLMYPHLRNNSNQHTDLSIFVKRTMVLVVSYLILNICLIPLSLYISGVIYLNYSPLEDFIPYAVFLIFFTAFLIGASVASWLFINLVKSRYSYPMFEHRWEIILEIEIDDEHKRVLENNWEKGSMIHRKEGQPENVPPLGNSSVVPAT